MFGLISRQRYVAKDDARKRTSAIAQQAECRKQESLETRNSRAHTALILVLRKRHRNLRNIFDLGFETRDLHSALSPKDAIQQQSQQAGCRKLNIDVLDGLDAYSNCHNKRDAANLT